MARIINEYPTLDEVEKAVKKGLATESDFRTQARQLFSTVNKRIQRLQNSTGVISPALTALSKKRDGNVHFSANRNFDDLKKEYAQAYAYYNLETGTLSGSKKFTSKLESKLGERVKDKGYVSSVFDTLHAIEERIPSVLFKNMMGTNEILQQILEETIEEETDMFEKTEAERDAYISRQVEKIVDQIYNESKSASEQINAGLENAFNSLW